jgi:integrase
MPRRRSTFGHVEYRGRGVWRVRWVETRMGVRARRSETVHGTRREAERRLAEIRASLDDDGRGGRALVRRCTIAEAWEAWTLPRMERRLAEGRMAQNTYKCRLSKWRRYVGPRWGAVRCDEVRALDIQEWLPTMTAKPAADSLALLRQVLDDCMLYEQVGHNVARRAFEMPTRQASRKDGAYTLAELATIAGAARGMSTEGAMLASMFGSARTGEALGIRLDDVSEAHAHGLTLAVLEVRRQVTDGGGVAEALKTEQSRRALVIPPPWSARVLEIAAEGRAAGREWLSEDGIGMPLPQPVLVREWREACASAGLEPKAPRAARRSWETYMRWEMGVRPDLVEAMMGHKLPGVTGAHYDKPTAEAFVETVAQAFAEHPFES